MPSLGTLVIAVVFLTCTAVHRAQGQDVQKVRATESTGGVFGADRRAPERRDKLDLSMVFNLMTDSETNQRSAYSNVEGLLSYRRKNRQVMFAADTKTRVQHSAQGHSWAGDYEARAALEIPVRRRTRLSVSQHVAYLQSYQLPTFSGRSVDDAGFSPKGDVRQTVARLATYTSTTTARVTERLSRRSWIDADYNRESVYFTGDVVDLRTWGAHGRVNRQMTRFTALHAAYGQRFGRYSALASAHDLRIHDMAVGLNYSRSRATTLSVVPGSSIIDGKHGRRFRMTGEVAMNHSGSRSTAGTAYRRNFRFVEGFAEPFFLDSISATFTRDIGRRIELSISGDYATGDIGLATPARFNSYSALAGGTLAITRHYALSVEYLYRGHRFPGHVAIPSASTLQRQSVLAGLRMWKPLR